MEITITDQAVLKIEEKIKGKKGFLKLKYNTDGCGCAVNGVVELWFTPETEDNEIAIETNKWNLYIEKAKAVFYDEKMKIDFSNEANCFRLISPQQILNGRMSLFIMNFQYERLNRLNG